MDAGEESLDDAGLSERLRDKARRINRRAIITALAITVMALAFP
jgi:hypothetical protein